MGNRKNAAAAAAAQKAAPQQDKHEQQNQEEFAKIVKASQVGLTGDSKVLLASLIDKRWVNNPNLPAEVIDGANILTDSLLADVVVTNIVEGKEMFALIVRNDEKKYLSIQAMLGSMGIKTPEFNALPAPSQEALDAASVKLLPAETKVINISKENVSAEAVEQKKKELENEKKKPTTDPTKVENEQQLADSLLALLTSATLSPDKRIQTAINFEQSYLKIQASKAENKDEELKKVNEMSRSAILQNIIDIVGTCPFAINGIGKMFHGTVVKTGTPISAFCLYRRNSTNAAGKVAHTDDFIADIVKMMVVWSCKTNIANAEKTISEMERAIKKNPTKKAEFETTIASKKAEIAMHNGVMEIVNNPSMDIVDNLITDYNAEDQETDSYKIAHRIVENIKDTYYKDVTVTELNKSVILGNCQQIAGVILNLFRDALDSNPTYSLANLVDIPVPEKKKEEKKEEEKPAEEKPKN